MMNLKEFWKYMITDKAKTEKPKEQKEKHLELSTTESTAKKKLTTPIILFILINSILGSSLFYLPGLGVISSGAASIIAWIVLFIFATLITLYIGELITLHPTSGGTFEYCKRAYGRFGAFMAGWLIWIAGNFGMALNLVAAAEYFIPEQSQTAFILRMVFALVWILVLNYMAFRGIDAGVSMLVTFGVIATIVVLIMTLPSFIDIPSLFQGNIGSPFSLELMFPFFRHEGVSLFAYLGLSLLLISEAFLGFETISYMANEAERPKKLHKVLIGATIISGIIMCLYIFSSLGTVTYHDYVSNARPFAVQALNTMGNIGQKIVVFGMYLTIVGAAAAWPITGSRLIRAMAHDKLFLRHFAVLHPKHKSPFKAVYFQTIMVLLFTWFIFRGYLVNWENPYRTIYLIYVLLSLIVVALVLLTVPILRKKEADKERPFKAPFGRSVPILMVIFLGVLLYNWISIEGGTAWSIIQLAGSFIILGIPFYFFVEMLYDQEAIVKVNEKLSYVALLGEKIFFPFTIRNKLFKDMGDMEGKKILEFGCAFGGLTRKLAPKVTEKGRIFATDLSISKVKIADKRTKHFDHVSVHHLPHLDDFKLKLPKIDGVLSIGMLSYMQKPEKILKKLASYVKKDGEIVFLDYDKFFYIIPNVLWIKDDNKLKAMFRRAGFIIDVERKKGLLWTYVIISGKKV